jgi:hypothetical protein
MKSYTMNKACQTADLGTAKIVEWLEGLRITKSVINVEDKKEYQMMDIDLLWELNTGEWRSIEIKVDNYFETGNYFFETKSNIEKGTPGCFMYSGANLLFYYFLDRELHIMPLKSTRKWFKANQERFRTVRTSTSVGNGKYHTEGALIKRDILKNECAVTIIKL